MVIATRFILIPITCVLFTSCSQKSVQGIYKGIGPNAVGIIKLDSAGNYDYTFNVDMFYLESSGYYRSVNRKVIFNSFDSLTYINGSSLEKIVSGEGYKILVKSESGEMVRNWPILLNGTRNSKTDENGIVYSSSQIKTILILGDYHFFHRVRSPKTNRIEMVVRPNQPRRRHFINEVFQMKKNKLISQEGFVFRRQ